MNVMGDFMANFTELYDSSQNLINEHQDRNGFHNVVSIDSAEFNAYLNNVTTNFSFRFIMNTHLYREWSDRYFIMQHSAELQNELVDDQEQRDDEDSSTIRMDVTFDFTSIDRSVENASNRIRGIV
jgi:hypothetical protein